MALRTFVTVAFLLVASLADEAARGTFATTHNDGAWGLISRQIECIIECGNGCMPVGAECCSETDGNYCTAGSVCDSPTTCCPLGETCTLPPTECDEEGFVLCGTVCVPPSQGCGDGDGDLPDDGEDDSTFIPTISGGGGGGDLTPTSTEAESESTPSSSSNGGSGNGGSSNGGDDNKGSEGGSGAAGYKCSPGVTLVLAVVIGLLP